MCKTLSQLLPAGVAWFLLVGSTAFFYALVAPRLMQDDVWGSRAYFVVGVDVVLFLLVVSNLVMAMCLDPGIYPIATVSEEQNGGDEFRSPLYKNVVINGISVRMKWCVTCKFYRPPRASHCSVCNRCIDNFDHHCPWVHNCVGWRNYRYFFFFLVFLSIHMVYVFGTCGTFVVQQLQLPTSKGMQTDPPILCCYALLILTLVLAIPVVGLTVFHIVLVVRGRSTNEQVTGKFQSGFNPFTKGWMDNCAFALCHSQTPSFLGYPKSRAKKRVEQRNKRTLKVMVTDETSVLYVPDGDGKDGGHIRLKQMRHGDSDSVGTALSLGRREEKSHTANGSTCNLYEDKNSSAAAYEASVAEAMQGSSLSAGSPTSERLALLNGDRRGKPLAFSDAMRIHDELSSPTKAVNL